MTRERLWMQQSQRGDLAAFNRLVTNHEAVAFGLAYHLLGDRAVGRPQWEFAPLEVKPIEFGDLPGLQYGFTMTDSEGVVRERVLSHVAFDESHIYFVSAAYDPDAVWSLPSDEVLLTFEPYLLDIIRALPLPKENGWRQ